VLAEHTFEVFSLPLHHLDPFDRLLIAQARVNDLSIVTGDRAFAQYDVRRTPI
jgi:PIN domain nuclease of toxin-antitoxin system